MSASGGLQVVRPVTDEDEWAYWISRRLRRRRRELGMTQDEMIRRLAEAGLHLSAASLSRAEAGQAQVAKGGLLFVSFARALRCSVTYLLGLTSDPDRWEPDVPLWEPEQ
jgi:transcriptional regulator with XRE-family HTH domain